MVELLFFVYKALAFCALACVGEGSGDRKFSENPKRGPIEMTLVKDMWLECVV